MQELGPSEEIVAERSPLWTAIVPESMRAEFARIRDWECTHTLRCRMGISLLARIALDARELV